jgi:hypothetical protein
VDLKEMSLDELTQLEAAIYGERARRAGKAVIVRDRNGRHPCPAGGALLAVDWAVSDQSYLAWYPTRAAARAALAALAASEGRVPESPDYVDLTYDGCLPSTAEVLAPRD